MPTTMRERKLWAGALALHVSALAVVATEVAVALWSVYWPVEEQCQELRTQTAALQQILSRGDKIKDENLQLAGQLAELESRSANMWERIPLEPSEAEFLSEISELATHVGLELSNYCPGNAEQRAHYDEMEVRLALKGGYGGICRFIERIHSLHRLNRVNQLSIGSEPSGKHYPVDLTLSVFFAPKPEGQTSKAKGS
jgi:Tfp pilus assembly protein PilO